MRLWNLEITLEFWRKREVGQDEFDLAILRRSTGVRFRFGERTSLLGWDREDRSYTEKRKEYTRLRDHFAEQEKLIAKGKASDPLLMTAEERREATKKKTRKMKFSPDFVYQMTTPLALQAIERGYAFDPMSGRTVLSPETADKEKALRFLLGEEKAKQLAGMTRSDFFELREDWLKQSPSLLEGVQGAAQ